MWKTDIQAIGTLRLHFELRWGEPCKLLKGFIEGHFVVEAGIKGKRFDLAVITSSQQALCFFYP
jgi:hypothetical protein